VGVIGIGSVAAFAVVRLADRWGRRPLLMITIAGYTLFTFLTGFSPGVITFAVFQALGRVFLIGEWALSAVVAAEEFPAPRRGFAIGVIQGCSALGSITCAAVTPLLLRGSYGWRTVYLVGVIPLVLLAFARRGLKETERFTALQGSGERPPSLWEILRTRHRQRVLLMAMVWGLTYMCTQSAVFFWKEFAVGERGLTDARVGLAIAVASLLSLPAVFAAGKLFDAWGRKPSATLIYTLLALSVIAAYRLHGYWLLVAALTLAIFCNGSVLALLNTFTTELFPTERRGEAFAWANNLLGRISYVIAPILVGAAAGSFGWSLAVSATVVFPLMGLALILMRLPETNRRELEETARV